MIIIVRKGKGCGSRGENMIAIKERRVGRDRISATPKIPHLLSRAELDRPRCKPSYLTHMIIVPRT